MIEATSFLILTVAFAAFILASCVWVLAHGAAAWADAKAAEHRARAHGIEADMQRDTIEQARDAADRVISSGRLPPTPDEIREAILRQRAAGNGVSEAHEYTTSGDVTPDELNEHMQGGEFRAAEL